MDSNYELRCPYCCGVIEHDDTYNLDICGESGIIAFCIGHCPNCDKEYQWQEEYKLKPNGIHNFEEVS